MPYNISFASLFLTHTSHRLRKEIEPRKFMAIGIPSVEMVVAGQKVNGK